MKKLLLLFITLNTYCQINDVGVFNFNDYSSYNKCNQATQLSSGLSITTFGNETINTNKVIDNTTYSIEIFGTLTNNNSSHFGFGIKSGNSFRSIMYRGSTGAVQGINYCTTTLQTPDYRTSGITYKIGDKVSVKVTYLSADKITFQTSKNGIYTTPITATMNVKFGELCICIRSASSWSNVCVDVQTNNSYKASTIISNANQLEQAISDTKGVGTIYLQSGTYYNFPLTFQRPIKLVGVGNVMLKYGEVINNATFSNGIYSIPHTTIAGINQYITLWQDNVISPRLPSMKMNYVGSISLVQSSNVPCWHQANGMLYFKIANGTNLIDNPVIIPSRGNNTVNHYVIGGGVANNEVYIDNISFLYAPMDLSNTHFMLKNVMGGCVNSNYVFQCGYSVGSTFENCEAFGCNSLTGGVGDGFNAHSDIGVGVETYIYFIYCYAHDNMDDGFSWHQYCFADCYGCFAEYNGNGFTVASGGDGIFEYCNASNNTVTGFGVTSIPLDGTEFTEADLLYCVGENNGTNFWKHQINETKMTCTGCTSVGINHFSDGINLFECNIVEN